MKLWSADVNEVDRFNQDTLAKDKRPIDRDLPNFLS